MTRTVTIVSDLHLGADSQMFGSDELLAQVIRDRARRTERQDLVLAGDIVDFPSIALDGRYTSWSRSPVEATRRLDVALERHVEIFDALKEFLAAGHGLYIIVGNHDVELALPEVQAHIDDVLDPTGSRRPRWIDDGRALRIGRLLIEHGNRYDYANLNDWDGLRHLRSTSSRGEELPRALSVSVGSEFVAACLAGLKVDYPLIDLLQPSGLLTVYLLLAIEPALASEYGKIKLALRAYYQSARNREGLPPVTAAHAAGGIDEISDRLFGTPPTHAELAGILSVEPLDFVRTVLDRSPGIGLVLRARQAGGLGAAIQRGEGVPEPIARNAREVLVKLRDAAAPSSPKQRAAEPGARAAQRMVDSAACDLVVMGHTHVAACLRREGREQPYYINTGTWIDAIIVDAEHCADQQSATTWLERFVKADRGLCTRLPSMAEVEIGRDGSVLQARLVRNRNGSWEQATPNTLSALDLQR